MVFLTMPFTSCSSKKGISWTTLSLHGGAVRKAGQEMKAIFKEYQESSLHCIAWRWRDPMQCLLFATALCNTITSERENTHRSRVESARARISWLARTRNSWSPRSFWLLNWIWRPQNYIRGSRNHQQKLVYNDVLWQIHMRIMKARTIVKKKAGQLKNNQSLAKIIACCCSFIDLHWPKKKKKWEFVTNAAREKNAAFETFGCWHCRCAVLKLHL